MGPTPPPLLGTIQMVATGVSDFTGLDITVPCNNAKIITPQHIQMVPLNEGRAIAGREKRMKEEKIGGKKGTKKRKRKRKRYASENKMVRREEPLRTKKPSFLRLWNPVAISDRSKRDNRPPEANPSTILKVQREIRLAVFPVQQPDDCPGNRG